MELKGVCAAPARFVLCAAPMLWACGSGGSGTRGAGGIIGRVEVSEGVPASRGTVGLRGTPVGVEIGADGSFELSNAPAGAWDLEIQVGGEFSGYPPYTQRVAVNGKRLTNVGTIRVFPPGFVSGTVIAVAGSPSQAVVGVARRGAVTAPSSEGIYVLGRVPPGTQDIVAVMNGGSVTRSGIAVQPNATTRYVDFDFAFANTEPAQIYGSARFMDETAAGIEVEVLQARDGVLVDRVVVDSSSTFSFPVVPDAYVVRARGGGVSNDISVPSGALAAGSAFEINFRLSVGDADGDGFPDVEDPDIDNDGVPNEKDAFPYDRRDWQDSDGDGIGDSCDPDTTEDTDRDGVVDGADNCVVDANPDQVDADSDGAGDACDACSGCECESDAECDDGFFCNGAEFCDGDNHCVSGPPLVVDDGIPCTDDFCAESFDQVVHLPVDAICSDDERCTVDQCNPASGCVNEQRALIYDQTGANVLLANAVEGRAMTSIYTDEVTQFALAYDAGGYALLIVDAPEGLPGSVKTRVSDWVLSGKPAIVHARQDFFDSSFAATLGVATSTSFGQQIVTSVPFLGVDLFSLAEVFAGLSLGMSSAQRIEVTPLPGGAIAALHDQGGAAIAVTHDASTIVNSFSTYDLFLLARDDDLDSKFDGQELVENELQYLCEPVVPLDPPESRRLSSGSLHNCALTESGLVRCFGVGASYQLGLGSPANIGDDEDPETAPSVAVGAAAIEIATGSTHSCALLEDSAVRCWGSSFNGQLGYGNTLSIGDNEEPSTAGNVDVGGPVKQIAAGGSHTCALLTDGSVRCWGNGLSGRLGYGNTLSIGDNETPASAGPVNLGGVAVQIAAGGAHTCALLDTGAVRCWGEATGGALGYGNEFDIGDDEAPAAAGDVALGGNATAVACGALHTCALLDNGEVRCWGSGGNGQLGYANQQNIGDNETPASAGSVTLGGVATKVAAGGLHTCALQLGRHIRCWGAGNGGQLGYGNTLIIGDDETPGSVLPVDYGAGEVEEISAGASHTCILLSGDIIRCWGDNTGGQLGYGNVQNIGDNEMPVSAGDVLWLPATGAPIALGAGDGHTCALTTQGTVRCWGAASHGETGQGNTVPIGDDEEAASANDVQLGEAVVQIAVGAHHTCALLTSNSVRCWGEGTFGQLGSGATADVGDDELPGTLPAVNVGGTVIGLAAGESHTCALLTGGAVRCWGRNDMGQLGYGNTDNIGDNETPASAGDVKVGAPATKIAAGTSHTCALLIGGAVRCWGSGTVGRLGHGNENSIGDDELPFVAGDVPIGVLATDLTVGSAHTCILDSQGDVHCWGYAEFGQLGYGNTNNLGDNESIVGVSGPVMLLQDAVKVAAGGLHTCALLQNDLVQCWGLNIFGQLGYGNTTFIGDDELPSNAGVVDFTGSANRIATGRSHTCVAVAEGSLYCWGQAVNGQLGYGNLDAVGDNETPQSVGAVPWQ